MADKEAVPKIDAAVVMGIYPDVCLSPKDPVPYQIVAQCTDFTQVSTNTSFTGVPAAHKGSRISTVYGDEPGSGGGVRSGVNQGYCRPVANWAEKFKVNGQPVLRHDTEFDMNCAGPEGAGNTTGKAVYRTGAPITSVGSDGAIQGNTMPALAATEPEASYLQEAWKKGKELGSQAWEKSKELGSMALDTARQAESDYHISTRMYGGLMVAGSVGEAALSGLGIITPTGITQLAGWAGLVHSADVGSAGLKQAWTGQTQETLTKQAASMALGETGGTMVDVGASMMNLPNAVRQAGTAVAGQVGKAQAGQQAAEQVAAGQGAKQAEQVVAGQGAKQAEQVAAGQGAKQGEQVAAGQGAKPTAPSTTAKADDGAQIHALAGRMTVSHDGMARWVKVSGDPRAAVRIERSFSGDIHVTDIFRGDLPPGSGSDLLATGLKAEGLQAGGQFSFTGIINPETLAAYNSGVPAAESLLGKVGVSALGKLGLEASSVNYELMRGKLAVTIGVK